jgi:hypothetical protein
MTIVIAHQTTAARAIEIVDSSVNSLFETVAGPHVELADKKRSWSGPAMDFSLNAKMGFISVPLSGRILVDDINVTVDCVLPALVKQFIGEEKIRAALDGKVRRMISGQL